ncbi:hypothetical protein Ddye_011511 [Dipteronia dyeriana]|uniref:Macro domain-containing protein n=1 Tax=Dipteronia dyeriana TaxID=168575 RepID=A0AAE0CH44_9ROSI|nr:hypothetical protein Ddye_011511 [Dipteronia dyeriana]
MAATEMDSEPHRRRRNDILWDICRLIAGSFYKGCESLGMKNKRGRAIIFVGLEAISIVLDLVGRSKWGFLLAAFLLSVFGFVITIYTCTKKHTSIVTTRSEAERQVIAVEIVFSVVQLIVTFIHFVLAVFGLKSNIYSVSVFPLAFAIVLVFKEHHEEVADLPWNGHIITSRFPNEDRVHAENSAMPMTHLRPISSTTPSDNGADQNEYRLKNIKIEQGPGDNTSRENELSSEQQDRTSDNNEGDFKFKSNLKILKGDITQWFVNHIFDAIVNPTNELMLGGGGCDGAIHEAAGRKLLEACFKVPEVRPWVRCPVGEARITPGFELPASRVIHTVGPIFGWDSNPEASLRNAYKNCLRVAKENNIQYVAFPAISCGHNGYPLEEAATIALSTIKDFGNHLKEVYFVLFLDDVYNVWLNKAKELF